MTRLVVGAAIPLVALLAGCAILGVEGDEPVTEVPEVSEEAPAEGSAPAEDLAIAEIIEALQEGDIKRADPALDRFLEEEPEHRVARSLRAQLDADPREELGSAYFSHTVEPGETLGQLARRYLGDANRFLILARYNDIDRPSRLLAGQRLRIPETAAREAPAANAEGLDEQLAALGGRDDEDAYLRAIEADLEAGRYGEARDGVRQARAQADNGLRGQRLDELERAVEGRYWEQRGHEARDAGDAEAALAAYDRALEADSSRDAAREAREKLREQRKDELHSAAIQRYRNQDLEEAIALWDEALKLDPEFEAARGYRLRALELQRRLERLGRSEEGAS
ncbi:MULTISPECIES: LysM domain-containing protein [unclassified Thioalkalivibrio]|uniref:LysM peptidoglycan-binding domain-containing protein n=1 Tax=unclassified Thioalkalivibrio TaxID=2621013 RepID=UPI00035F8731|nr:MULTISPECIES: LysM domain-containing protein [unclassified Thioalkalivibrio]